MNVKKKFFSFPKSDRLLSQRDFRRVMRFSSCRVNGHVLQFSFYPVHKSQVRLGISISRKVAKAVVRNKIKRRIREIFRIYMRESFLGYWIHIKVKKADICEFSFRKLRQDFIHASDRLEQDTEGS